jgi:hypothetical protein
MPLTFHIGNRGTDKNGSLISTVGPYLRLSTASPSIFNADSQAGGRGLGEPLLILAPFGTDKPIVAA